MAPTKIGTHYYATIDPDLDYELDKQNHLISTASIDNGEGNEDVVYECTSDLLIEASGSLVTDNVINTADGNIYFGGKGSIIEPTEISLKDIIDAQSTGGYKKQIKYKITGNGEATLTTDIDIINRDDYQNDIAGKQIDLTITNKNLVCTVKGLQEKAYATFEDLIQEYWNYPIVTASFVNYIPSDLETENIVSHMDVSDIDSGTSEGSVIAWFETTDKVYEYEESLYNLYIGSESEIYVKDLTEAFAYTSLETITFDNLNTSETTDMSFMFAEYQGTELDLSTFDTSKVINMSYMFSNTSVELPFKDWSNFVTTNVEDMSDMFDGYQGTSLDLSNFDTSKVTDMSSMFFDCNNLTSLNLSNFDTSKVTDMSSMFSYTGANITFPSVFGTGATDMSNMFSYYQGTTLDLSSFDTSKVTDMSSMFSNTSVDLPFQNWPQFVTTKVEDMSNMFSYYQGTTLDLSSFDTSKVTDMSNMFYYCMKLTSLDLSSFDTSKVTDMSNMFCYCMKLTSLDLSSFTFDNVKDEIYDEYGNSYSGFEDTFYDVPESCQVKIKSSQLELFKSKFSYDFAPTPVD